MVGKKTEGRKSPLNPNAAVFIPAAWHAVEDFSPEWFRLAESHPQFQDYWMKKQQTLSDEEVLFADDMQALQDLDELLEKEEKKLRMLKLAADEAKIDSVLKTDDVNADHDLDGPLEKEEELHMQQAATEQAEVQQVDETDQSNEDEPVSPKTDSSQ